MVSDGDLPHVLLPGFAARTRDPTRFADTSSCSSPSAQGSANHAGLCLSGTSHAPTVVAHLWHTASTSSPVPGQTTESIHAGQITSRDPCRVIRWHS